MSDIVERLRFDSARCEATFSKGIAKNIEEAVDEIERLRADRDLWKARCLGALWLVPDEKTCGELQEAAKTARQLLDGQSGAKEGE